MSTESLLAQMREVDLSIAPERIGTVYVLLDDHRVTYVGQTTNAGQRIAMHQYGTKNTAPKQFDRAFRLDVPLEDLDAYEGALIRCLAPRDCATAPKDTGRDTEVLARFGMKPCATAYAVFRAQQRARWARTGSARRVREWASRARWRSGVKLSSVLWRTALRAAAKVAA